MGIVSWREIVRLTPFILFQSDPIVVVNIKKGEGKLEELGRTEVMLNSLNPAWIEKITVSYQFEFVQPLM
jgi:hypothetical protein